MTGLDPTLFTVPIDGATGVSITNIPTGNTIAFDNPVNPGDDCLFAGAPGFDAGTITIS